MGIDDRYVGVADAGLTTSDVERLLEMTTVAGWITQDAAEHLGRTDGQPPSRRAWRSRGSRSSMTYSSSTCKATD